MTFKLSWSEVAQEDVREIISYIKFKFKAPDTARKIRDGIVMTGESLVFMPEGHTEIMDLDNKPTGYRYVPYKEYVLVYETFFATPDSGVVRVHRVFHRSQNWLAYLL